MIPRPGRRVAKNTTTGGDDVTDDELIDRRSEKG